MADFHRFLPILSLLPLPTEVQHLISRSSDVQMRRALAASNHTGADILNLLISDADRTTHHWALRRGTDIDQLQQRLERGTVCCAESVVRNPVCPADLLADAVAQSESRIALNAYVNPATPAEARAQLSVATVTDLVDVGEPLGDTVVRSHEAIITNRTLLEQADQFGPALRRAAYGLYDLTREQHQLLSTPGSRRYAKRHPVIRGEHGVISLTTEELLELHSPAADLWMATHEDSDITLARRMLSRTKYDVDPHIIARLLKRFGVAVIPGGEGRRLATTRVDSTSWSNPNGSFYNLVVEAHNKGIYEELEASCALLGEDLESWGNFLALAGDWSGTASALAQASRRL
jgi:hypothetical protein